MPQTVRESTQYTCNGLSQARKRHAAGRVRNIDMLGASAEIIEGYLRRGYPRDKERMLSHFPAEPADGS